MKKLGLAIVALLMMFALASCGTETPDEETPAVEAPVEAPAADVPAEAPAVEK